MQNPTGIRPRFIALGLISALAACSNDYVDLGGGSLPQSAALGSRCAESVIVEGDVVVENQVQLDALLGCEEVRGHLSIQVFEDTDLTALAELRAVDGVLAIGAFPEYPSDSEDDEAYFIEANRLTAIAEANWLPSLAGLESLERFGGLSLAFTSAPSLEAFESLRLVTGGERRGWGGRAGWLVITAAPNLVDLRGLDDARGFRGVDLVDNPALETLNGLQVGDVLDSLTLRNNRSLTNIEALSSLSQAEIYITGTAIANADALANLQFTSALELKDNPELTNVDALAGLLSAEYLGFEQNAKLQSLPEFSNIFDVQSFIAASNPALDSLSLNFPNRAALAIGPAQNGRYTENVITIIGNDRLTSVAFGLGLQSAGAVSISENANLASIDLGYLQAIDDLWIIDNTTLRGVELGALQTVDSLAVIGNPLLSTTHLSTVRTFESWVHENADDPPPAP